MNYNLHRKVAYRKTVQPTSVWYHPAHGSATWPELKAIFASVGGITVLRLRMLGWRPTEAEAKNPVNQILG